jgi:hypothetical protein
LTPTDEFQYWADVAAHGKKGEERDRAQFFSDLFQKQIAPQFQSMGTLTMSAIMDLVEETQDVLDEIWKQTEFDKPYPEARMRRLVEVIGRVSFIILVSSLASVESKCSTIMIPDVNLRFSSLLHWNV